MDRRERLTSPGDGHIDSPTESPFGLKAQVLDGEKPHIELSFAQAAQAFATSMTALQALAEGELTLVLQPHSETKTVTIELIKSVPDVRRNLWNELLDTLKEGQVSRTKKKKIYEFVYGFIHWFDEEGGDLDSDEVQIPEELLKVQAFKRVWDGCLAGGCPEEEELRVLTAYGWAVYGQLGGMQEEVFDPTLLRTSHLALEG